MSNHTSSDNDLRLTKDGSHTLYSHQFEQHYHNPNGAVAESRHNFFETNNLLQALQNRTEITILEIGFGTGLNLLLLLDYYLSFKSRSRVYFYSVEAYPISSDQVRIFNYENHLQHPELKQKLTAIFESLEPGFNEFELLPNISAHIFYGLFDKFNHESLKAEFIYHDAFSPKVNPDLWSGSVFKKLHGMSADSCLLTTYSTAAHAKAALCWAGWKVAKTRGALGKREMIVASPTEKPLAGFSRINENHFADRYEHEDF